MVDCAATYGSNPRAGGSGHKALYLLYIKRLQYIMLFLRLSTIMPVRHTSRILALDTSSLRGSVALLEGHEIRAELRLSSLQNHSINLLSEIDFLLSRQGWSLQELDLVAVGTGPGSFTGIRIGIATAMGIAQSTSIPFAGISGLDALANQASYLNGNIGVLLDAQRSQAYYAEYVCKGGVVRSVQKSALFCISDLEHRLANRHLYIVGDIRSERLETAKSSKSGWPRFIVVDLFLAASIGRLAFSKKRRWRSANYIVCDPLYIRPPDALGKKAGSR